MTIFIENEYNGEISLDCAHYANLVAEQVLESDFSEEEMKKLRKSAEELGAVLDQVNIEK